MTFDQPFWLLFLLLIPLFVGGAILTARLRKKQWAAFVSSRLRPRLLRRGSPLPRWVAFSLLMASIALLLVSLARPQLKKGTETEKTKGRNVMLAIDLSRSMLVKDLKPDRLSQAKTLCYELIEAMPNDRIGVVGFAGEPYLFAPLTIDHGSVRETIDQLDINTIPVGGTNLAGALELAVKTLKETGQKENALVLLTDGEETTGRMTRAIQKAKEEGVYVFAIAMGTENGDFVPDKDFDDGHHRDKSGRPVMSKLETSGLRTLARETNGRFAVATSATNIPAMVTAAISDLAQFEIAGRERTIAVEYFQWFLLPAILLLIASAVAGTRWRGLGPAGVAALFFLVPTPSRAALEDDAKRLLEEGRNAEAAELFGKLADESHESSKAFRFRIGQGTAAYRQGDLDIARAAFSEALRADDPRVRAAAHHGLGNAIFGHGWETLSGGPAYPETAKPEEGRKNAFQQILDALLGKIGQKEDAPEEGKPDPMAPFDEMVRGRLMEWLKSDVPDGGQSEGSTLFNGVLTDWIDAVKHYNAAIDYDSSLEDARHNRALTVKYLKRLREIFEEVEQNSQQIQPMPQPGQGQGQGPPQPNGRGRGEGKGQGQGNPQDQGDQGDRKDQGQGGDEEKDQDGSGGDNKDKKDADGDEKNGMKPKPGESPEDTARRILKENADYEKGVPSKARIDYEQPDKDW